MSYFRNPLLSFWPGTWLLVFAFAAHAQFIFTTNSNNTITITGFAGSNSLVAIPAMINGYPVTGIGHDAFNQNYFLTQPSHKPENLTKRDRNSSKYCGGR